MGFQKFRKKSKINSALVVRIFFLFLELKNQNFEYWMSTSRRMVYRYLENIIDKNTLINIKNFSRQNDCWKEGVYKIFICQYFKGLKKRWLWTLLHCSGVISSKRIFLSKKLSFPFRLIRIRFIRAFAHA